MYSTRVNITGNYLSGLLMIKKMPDGSTRFVFTSETGPSLFDFGFASDGDFKVYYIMKKLNRKAIIKTLRQDFELVLMQEVSTQTATIFKNGDRIYYAFPREKGSNYYITDPDCTELIGIEKASGRKALVNVLMKNGKDGIPDTIGISHANFHFTIGLKRAER